MAFKVISSAISACRLLSRTLDRSLYKSLTLCNVQSRSSEFLRRLWLQGFLQLLDPSVAAVFWFAEGARSLEESRQFYSFSSIEKGTVHTRC